MKIKDFTNWIQKKLIKPAQMPKAFTIRDKIALLEKFLKKIPGAHEGDDTCPLTHRWGDNLYIREVRCPKGMLLVTKLHKTTHPFFMTEGEVSILTENGVQRIKAPYSGITKAGTKRVIFIHENTVWTTVHATKHKDLKKIEREIIANDYKDLPISVRKSLPEDAEQRDNNDLIAFTKSISEEA